MIKEVVVVKLKMWELLELYDDTRLSSSVKRSTGTMCLLAEMSQ